MNTREILDEISQTVEAISDVATLLLEMESVGGCCLRVLLSISAK